MEARPVGVGEVERDHLHTPAPPLQRPVVHRRSLAALFPRTGRPRAGGPIDQGGGVDRGVGGLGRQVAVLVDAECSHQSHPSGVVDQRSAVEGDALPQRVPGHPVLVAHRGDRPAQLAHLAGHLGPTTQREDLAGDDAVDPLGPGLLDAALGLATPPALAHHQPTGSAETVQVPQNDVDPVLGLGPPTARRAAGLHFGRLDVDDHFTGPLDDIGHDHARQSQQSLRQSDTVGHGQGFLLVVVFDNSHDGGAPGPIGG